MSLWVLDIEVGPNIVIELHFRMGPARDPKR